MTRHEVFSARRARNSGNRRRRRRLIVSVAVGVLVLAVWQPPAWASTGPGELAAPTGNAPHTGQVFNKSHWSVQAGDTVKGSIENATDVSDGPVPVIVQSSIFGNVALTGQASGGVISFTWAATGRVCGTAPVAYVTAGHLTDNALIPGGDGQSVAGFALVDQSGNVINPGPDGSCPIAPSIGQGGSSGTGTGTGSGTGSETGSGTGTDPSARAAARAQARLAASGAPSSSGSGSATGSGSTSLSGSGGSLLSSVSGSGPSATSQTGATTAPGAAALSDATSPLSAPIAGATNVHAGEPWSGSLPMVAGTGMLGIACVAVGLSRRLRVSHRREVTVR